MQIAVSTIQTTPLAWEKNLNHILRAIADAKKANADLLSLPELCISGYGCEDYFFWPETQKRAWEQLQKILPHTKDIIVGVGLPFYFENKLYNAYALIDDTQIKTIHLKKNLAITGVHYENRYFTPWTANKTKKWKNILVGDPIYNKIAVQICEEAWVDEQPLQKKIGKFNIVLCPSASHFALGKSQRRIKLVKDQSKKLKCTFVYTNLIGLEAGRILYDGDLFIADRGKVKFSARKEKTSTEKEFLDAQIMYLSEYLKKSHSNGFIISLSGGCDSAVCAVLAKMVQKVTHCEVITIYQATAQSSKETLERAQKCAEELGLSFMKVDVQKNIDLAIRQAENLLKNKLTWDEDSLTLQNIQSRARVMIPWILSNKKNLLFISTANRSEVSVGYATMDGDTSGSLAPLTGVDKPFLRKWLKWYGEKFNHKSLIEIANADPTAELMPQEFSQTDEKDLMPYDTLQKIEENFLLHRQWNQKSADERKFMKLFFRSQWKRDRLAPSVHLDQYSLDSRSWLRLPIFCGDDSAIDS